MNECYRPSIDKNETNLLVFGGYSFPNERPMTEAHIVTLKHDLKKCFVAPVPTLGLPVSAFVEGESFRGNQTLAYRKTEVAMVGKDSIWALDPTLPVNKMQWESLATGLQCTHPNIVEPPSRSPRR